MTTTIVDFEKKLTGNGLIRPMRRLAGSDFISGSGSAIIISAIQQILGTRPGEMVWRPSFGLDLERFRHLNATESDLQQLSNTLQQALNRWEPRISVKQITITSEETKIHVRIVWSLRTNTSTGGDNIFGGINTTEVEV